MSLIHHLQQVYDYRTKPLYPLWVVMLLVIMGIMSGCTGYRAEDKICRTTPECLTQVVGTSVQAITIIVKE
jgi:hypothetical protein